MCGQFVSCATRFTKMYLCSVSTVNLSAHNPFKPKPHSKHILPGSLMCTWAVTWVMWAVILIKMWAVYVTKRTAVIDSISQHAKMLYLMMFTVSPSYMSCPYASLRFFAVFVNIFNQSMQYFTLSTVSCSEGAANGHPSFGCMFIYNGQLSVTGGLPKRLFLPTKNASADVCEDSTNNELNFMQKIRIEIDCKRD